MRGLTQNTKFLRPILSLAFLLLFLGLSIPSEALAGAPVQILPLGDSITDGVGSTDGSGYRRVLYHLLTTHGYSIRFAGNQANGPYDYDRKHEGHSGYTAEQIRQNIYLENGNWLGTQPADIILLHIGTNDISQGIQNVSKINDILNKIDLFEQNTGRAVTVILARIIQRAESDPGYQPTFEFNNAIENLALSRISAGDRLILVDMEGALNPSGDLIDAVHPNDSGYRKMAAVWFDAVTRVLPQGEQFFGQYIPQDIWLMHYVDSEETVGENGEAENAFDGDPTTIWHTKWFGGIDPLPHQLQIDLGQVYSIDGLRYLPRQDKQNGRVADYQIYVSSNGTTWGSAVAQGRFPNTAVEQTVTFPNVLGRYIRIVATSEVVGHAFVAIAELNATQSIQPAANYPPNGSITQPIKNLKINIGEQVDFSGSGSDADQDYPLTYRWSFGPGSGIPDSTIADPAAVRFNNPGVFEVRLTVCDSLGLCDPTPATRTVTVGTVSGVLPRSGWSVAYVDSQELIGENGAAANVFDGNANTFWHSKWYQGLDPLPHEIRINLGGSYVVSAFKYLPRQGMSNGRIADYAFYVSEDGVVWGSAVAQGRFPNTSAEQTVTFTEVSGRYVRLMALSEVNGNPITSVAELNVIGHAGSGGGNLAPNGAIDSPPGNLTVPVGGSVDFRGSGSDPDGNLPLSYAWNFGDPGIPTSSVEDPGLVTFPTAGTYTVRFTVTDALGLSDPTPATRTVTVGTVSGVLPRSGWSVAYVDSQELIGENGAAANVFDGNANTIWHSQWFQQLTPLPHEIRIDLGGRYTVTGFKYLPRQNMANGRIADYAFYVSEDGVVWGSAVAQGRFPNVAAEQTVSFSEATGRYVRLVALSEVNGNPITSVAELNVLGYAASGGGNQAPNGAIDSPPGNLTVPVGGSVDFRGSGSDPDGNLPLSYAWNFGDPGIPVSGVEDPGLVTFPNAGTFTVRFTVTDALGQSDPTPATRTITVGTSSAPLPRSGWSVKYVDSQELVGENGAAANVFDGNANTFWHSKWYQGLDPLPHEIRIDLGATYTVTGFRYLPRQGATINGRIAGYEFYVSIDAVNWGNAVASGTFPNTSAEQTVGFANASARFVRLRALSEVNGNPVTSVAELNVLGY